MDQGEREESAFNPDAWSYPGADAPQTEAQRPVQAPTGQLADELNAIAGIARGLADRLACVSQQASLQIGASESEKLPTLTDHLRAIREVATAAGGIDEVVTLENLLRAWQQKPSDLLIMVRVAEEAAILIRIVRAHLEILRLTEAE